MDAVVQSTSKDTLFGQDVRTVVIGIGAQKCGTTWLAQQLSRHPEVYMRRKELHYWDVIRAPYVKWDKMAWQSPRNDVASNVIRFLKKIARGEDRNAELFGKDPFDHSDYASYMLKGRAGQPVVAEVTPAYALCGAGTFAEMAALHDDVRFVFLMRDPVDRLWSGVKQRFRVLLEDGRVAGDLEDAFISACKDAFDPDLRRSRYDETLDALDEAGVNVIAMFYETLFTEAATSRLSAFLGIGPLDCDFEERVYSSAAQVELSSDAKALAHETLSPTYKKLRARFGSEVPEQWIN